MTAANGQTFSRQVLAETPGRATKFLGAAARGNDIRAILEAVGYLPPVHAEGWARLLKVLGYHGPEPEAAIDPEVRDAIVLVDRWDEPQFAIAAASLKTSHPDQERYLLGNLEPQEGSGAVGAVAVFLDRVDTLEKGRSPETRAADKDAVKKLATRGLDAAERKRVAALVKVAQGKAAAPAKSDAPEADDTADVLALKAWYDEWAAIAKAVIKRRDYLIRLGLAQPSRPKKARAPDAEK